MLCWDGRVGRGTEEVPRPQTWGWAVFLKEAASKLGPGGTVDGPMLKKARFRRFLKWPGRLRFVRDSCNRCQDYHNLGESGLSSKCEEK